MESFSFTALGTSWWLQSEDVPFSISLQETILKHVEAFEERFSRFRDHSEANQFRTASEGVYVISSPMHAMLERAQKLRELTYGRYDPAVAPLLEKAGYDKEYRFTPKEVEKVVLPEWRLEGEKLWIEGPVGFDFGGMGKGLCIDEVSEVVRNGGHKHFIVDAGGDMFATEKKSGLGFRIALEWPGKPDTAFGTLELRHQGLAVSDTFRRRWGKWHHIVDSHKKEPIAEVLGAAAVAKNAWEADSATAALFQVPVQDFPRIETTFGSSYVVFMATQEVHVSPAWPGEIFG